MLPKDLLVDLEKGDRTTEFLTKEVGGDDVAARDISFDDFREHLLNHAGALGGFGNGLGNVAQQMQQQYDPYRVTYTSTNSTTGFLGGNPWR